MKTRIYAAPSNHHFYCGKSEVRVNVRMPGLPEHLPAVIAMLSRPISPRMSLPLTAVNNTYNTIESSGRVLPRTMVQQLLHFARRLDVSELP